MVKATAIEVYTALDAESLPVVLVDAINDICYFSETVSDATVRAIITPLEWSTATITVIVTSEADPYPVYLDVTRHDQLLRHVLGTTVPRDSTKFDVDDLDTDVTLAANSDTKVATQKAVKTYIDTQSVINAIIFGGE